MSAIARPASVTLVGVVIVIFAVGSIIGAVAGLFDADMRVGATLITLILLLVLGLVYLLLAKGIFNGNNFARLVIGFISFLGLLTGLYHLIFVADLRVFGLVQVILEIIILALLFNRRANVFFAVN